MTQNRIGPIPMLAAGIGMTLVAASSALAADPVSSRIQHYCDETLLAAPLQSDSIEYQRAAIEYQRASEFKPVTVATGFLTTLKALVNPWSPPGDIAVHAYLLDSVIGPDGTGLARVPPTELLAIVNGNPEIGYFGTQVDWTDLQEFVEFQGSGSELDGSSAGMDIPDVDAFVKLGAASGALDMALDQPNLVHDALAFTYTPDCVTLDVSDKTKYQNLKTAWQGLDSYLVTTNPIPGLEKEKPFLTQRR